MNNDKATVVRNHCSLAGVNVFKDSDCIYLGFTNISASVPLFLFQGAAGPSAPPATLRELGTCSENAVAFLALIGTTQAVPVWHLYRDCVCTWVTQTSLAQQDQSTALTYKKTTCLLAEHFKTSLSCVLPPP